MHCIFFSRYAVRRKENQHLCKYLYKNHPVFNKSIRILKNITTLIIIIRWIIDILRNIQPIESTRSPGIYKLSQNSAKVPKVQFNVLQEQTQEKNSALCTTLFTCVK